MASQPELRIADLNIDRTELLDLNVAYVRWVLDGVEARFGLTPVEVVGSEPHVYAEANLHKVAGDLPPRGVFYLAHLGDAAVAMGGLRTIRAGIGEIKRIYVRPNARGQGLARLVLDRLIDDARTFGMSEVYLETAPFMTDAHRLYETSGFVDRTPYAEAEVPVALHDDWRFMALRPD
jgi:GNAT superfamily N-acetyltransferase